jgi:hypothetical protein
VVNKSNIQSKTPSRVTLNHDGIIVPSSPRSLKWSPPFRAFDYNVTEGEERANRIKIDGQNCNDGDQRAARQRGERSYRGTGHVIGHSRHKSESEEEEEIN